MRAWAAWGQWRGLADASLSGQSPLPVFGAMLSFLLFGPSDVAARLLPALAGVLCVALPFTLRRDLGRSGALLASAVLSLGPTFMLASRQVDGGIIVAAGALVVLACGLAYRRDENERSIYVAAIALGVMFSADRAAGPTALILGLLALVGWLRSDQERDLPVQALRNGALVFLATTAVLGTGLLSNLQGVQTALVDPLTVWITGAGATPLEQRLTFYTQALLAYEPFVLLFSILALSAAAGAAIKRRGVRFSLPGRGRDESEDDENTDDDSDDDSDADAAPASSAGFSLSPFLVAWSVLAAVFFLLLGDRSIASVVQVVLPLSLLTATFIGERIDSGEVAAAGRQVWLLSILVILIAFAVVPWLNPSSLFGGRFTSLERRIQNLTGILLAVLILAIVGAAAWYAYRLRLKNTLLALGAALAVALAVFTVHSAFQLNHVYWPNATEPLLAPRTSADVRTMLDDIVAVSRMQGDDAIAITLDDRLPQPVRWYLHRFLNVTTARVGANTKTPVVIAPADSKDALVRSLGRAYVNQRYRLRSIWQENAPLSRWLRWAHVRELINPPVGEDMIAFFKLPQ
jgi:hypothetical protein